MTRTRYRFSENDLPYFLTCTVVGRIPLFHDRYLAELLLDSLKYMQQHDRLVLYAYVIMENHLHLIAASGKISEEIGDFKSFTARSIIDELKNRKMHSLLKQLQRHKLPHKHDRTYQVWQEGSHPQLIQGHEMMRQKIEYIHGNPVRRGYVDDPVHWRYSSARNYAGSPGLLQVITELNRSDAEHRNEARLRNEVFRRPALAGSEQEQQRASTAMTP